MDQTPTLVVAQLVRASSLVSVVAGSIPAIQALVAQWVEQQTFNLRVTGSIPVYSTLQKRLLTRVSAQSWGVSMQY